MNQPINIPADMWERVPCKKDYPIQVNIELNGSTDKFDFDVMIVYDNYRDTPAVSNVTLQKVLDNC
jgi:hypothetical protein